MRELVVPKECVRILQKMQKWDKKLAGNISDHILDLENDPFPEQSVALQWYFPYRRIRVGKYRIIYICSDEEITIVYIWKREDVYEKMKKYISKNM